MLAEGSTNGVFQYESGGMKNVLVQLGPQSLEDLIAVISLYRSPALWIPFPNTSRTATIRSG